MTYLGSGRWQFNNGLIFEKWQLDEMIDELKDKHLVSNDFTHYFPPLPPKQKKPRVKKEKKPI